MIGTKLSERYEVISELGRGGMGVVYKANDPLLGREVAIKLISPNLLEFDIEQRFRSEAQTVAKMDHPSIVPIYDLGDHEGSLFFVMPVLAGQSLRKHLRGETLTLKDILEGVIQVAEGLEYSHNLGILHRDIKPENLMVSRDPAGNVRFRVMDFGLARDNNMSRVTKTGVLVGTMGYLSPEQVQGRPCDHRSDIYSLGTVLYECLVGELPFTGEMQSILYRIVHEIPQSPRGLGIDLDEELEAVVLGCLAKDPEERPARAGDLARSLRHYLDNHRESDRMLSVMVTQAVHSPRPALAPFVGREKELKALQTRLNAAKRGECQFAVVSGDAGVGKTRLLDELKELARAQQIPVLQGRFMEQDGAFPYHGFCELIQDHFRQKEGGSSAHGISDFSDLGSELVSIFPMLAEIEEIGSATGGSAMVAPSDASKSVENKSQIFELLARTLTRLAAGKPMLLVLEDLHGAEVSIEALQYIFLRLGPTPTLILGTYRPAELTRRSPLSRLLDSLQGDHRFEHLHLGPLSSSEHERLLSTLLGGRDVDSRLAGRLYEGSEGNPFFAKELVRSLLDSEGIVQDNTGTWRLSGGLSLASEELPETIQQAVEKRIAGLPPEIVQVLSTAAVMGKSFDFDDLESLLDDVDGLDDIADRLIQEGLIEEERRSRSDVMAFSSGVVREVLYAKLSRRKRRSLHREYARLLEKKHAGRLERVYPQLVYHYAEGDEPEKTVEYGLLHARKSLESFSPEEAIRAATLALEFLDDEWEGDPALAGEARLILARGYQLHGEVADGVRETETAVRIFEKERKSDRVVESILQAARMSWQARRAEETTSWIERGVAAARAAGDSPSLVEFLSLAATLANLRADYTKANEFLQEADRLKSGTQERKPTGELPRGGRLTVPIVTEVEDFDPAFISFDAQVEVSANVFETLLIADGEGRLLPLLCRDWTMADEGQTFVFTLREGVRFHDGASLTAEEVKRSFEQSIRHRGQEMRAAMSVIRGVREFLAGESDDVEGIVAAAANRLEFHLSEPLPIYPSLLTEANTGIARGRIENETARTVGTGPFRIVSREGNRILLERYDDYWNSPPLLDALEFRAGVSPSSLADGLRSGEFDLARSLPEEDLERLLRDPRFRGRMEETPGKSTFFILFNVLRGPIAHHVELRRALCGLIRVRDLIWHTKGRLAEPAAGIVPPGLLGHDPGRRRGAMSVEEARELIAKTGLATPIRIKAAVTPASAKRHEDLLRAISSAWSEVGVELELITTSQESYNEMVAEPEGIDIAMVGYISDYDDPDSMTYVLFDSGTGRYRKFFSSEASDELLQKARTEGRPEKRIALYRQFEDLLEEGGVLLPLFHETNYRIPGPRVRGMNLLNTPPYVNYRELAKAEEEISRREAVSRGKGMLSIPVLGLIAQSLDPMRATHIDEAEVGSCIFETLTRVEEGARLVPWLVSRIDVEDGGKTYRMVLREGLRFHDGRRLGSRDVRFSFERVLAAKECEFRFLLAQIVGADAVIKGESKELEGFHIHSSREFSIHLDMAVPFFPAILSHFGLGIMPEGVAFEGRSFREGIVGSGPFRVVQFDPGRRIEMERNPNYWRPGYPKSEGIQFEGVESGEGIYAGFVRGQYSLANYLPTERFEELRRSAEFAGGYREIPSLSTALFALNQHRGPLRDLETRRRFCAAIDRGAVCRAVSGASPAPARGLIPPGLLGHDPGGDSSVSAVRHARESAGEVELTVAISTALRAAFSQAVDQITAQLQDAGFRLKVLPVNDRKDFNRYLTEASADLILGAWVADYPDTHAMIHGILDSREGWAGRFCGSPDLDREIQRAQVEVDPVTRNTLYRDIEKRAARDAVVLPLFYLTVYRFARPEVKGLQLSFSTPDVRYEDLHTTG